MRLKFRLSLFLFFIVYLENVAQINCWESYELDLFDLVEEVNQNFYEFFGVSQVKRGLHIYLTVSYQYY